MTPESALKLHRLIELMTAVILPQVGQFQIVGDRSY